MANEQVERSWVLPEEPIPVRLMSTIWADTAGVHDDLRAPGDVDGWLDAVQIDRAGATATGDELAAAVALRDAVRRLAVHVTADTRVAAAASVTTDMREAIEHLNAAAAHAAAAVLTLRDGQLNLGVEPGISPVTAGLARVAEDSMQLLAGESATGLRACYAPGCVLYFVKSHPRREWCSIACGNRARAARHYQRTRPNQ